uniref:Uncharacterized protein n=1 Tax=Arundo donax TaxID=35708 RepID=A0A0A8YP86_ARUDO
MGTPLVPVTYTIPGALTSLRAIRVPKKISRRKRMLQMLIMLIKVQFQLQTMGI